MDKKWDAIWFNGSLVKCENGYCFTKNAAIAVKNKKIAWLGKMSELFGSVNELANHCYDLQGRCLTPGLIDAHTHVIYAGNRAHEFEQRLQGISYEEIARRGGGIQSTVTATRAASEDELLAQSLPRITAMLANGVTTLEIKSGYGLDFSSELKILRVAKRIENLLPLTIIKTFLGAHIVPQEYHDQADKYLDLICHELIPTIAKEQLADHVDVFCEKIAFNLEQTERVFKAAQQYKLGIKCHAEQLSDSNATQLAAKYRALSVDHLEYLSLGGIKAMVESNTVAVLLPGAFYYLREKKLPPIDLLREYNIPMAIATDCNPGTSPVISLLLILNMACTIFRLTPEEALLGVTQQAAKALGIENNLGTLTVGKSADFAVWNIDHPTELAYYVGANPLHQLVKAGEIQTI